MLLNRTHPISKKKIAALVVGTMLIAFVLLFLFISRHQPLMLPQFILQLRLTEEIRGTQAQEIIDAMYKKPVTPDENVSGKYFSTDGSAKLYVSLYDSRAIAEKQLSEMIDLLRLEKSNYSDFRELQVQNEKVYACIGLGQSHYLFLHETKLYWWAVDMQIAQASMQELVRIVKINTQK